MFSIKWPVRIRLLIWNNSNFLLLGNGHRLRVKVIDNGNNKVDFDSTVHIFSADLCGAQIQYDPLEPTTNNPFCINGNDDKTPEDRSSEVRTLISGIVLNSSLRCSSVQKKERIISL